MWIEHMTFRYQLIEEFSSVRRSSAEAALVQGTLLPWTSTLEIYEHRVTIMASAFGLYYLPYVITGFKRTASHASYWVTLLSARST
ncbi:hypothetical protein HZ326_23599 [Fusarium oxysporum f. sp. albedinis]|nr:hypothetical protein HZ326_23599 [Fusarium oxysporum f. sp. albedinis]